MNGTAHWVSHAPTASASGRALRRAHGLFAANELDVFQSQVPKPGQRSLRRQQRLRQHSRAMCPGRAVADDTARSGTSGPAERGW
jgi:hypothetical protein